MDRPIATPWWRSKRTVRLGIVVTALILGALSFRLFLGPAERSVRMSLANVTVAPVTQGAFHDFVPLRATVVPLETIYLDATEGGRVERILAQAGDNVTQGQPLIELSNTQLELDVLDREGRLIESMTQLQAYQTELEQNRVANQKALAQIDYDIVNTRRTLERHRVLLAASSVSLETVDKLQEQLDLNMKLRAMQDASNRTQEQLRIQQLPQIRNQLAKLHEDLQITHSKLESLIVRAPAAGRITSLDLKMGENRNRGDRLAEITPGTGVKLAANVDEYYLARVHVGQSARVDIDEHSLACRVTRVYPQVKEGSFTIDLLFKDPAPPGLLPGQAVQGRLSLGADRAAMLLPAGAFLERSGGGWAFVVDDDARVARRRPIRLGRRNSEQVEVLGGLSVGERVIVSDYSGLEHTDRIDLKK